MSWACRWQWTQGPVCALPCVRSAQLQDNRRENPTVERYNKTYLLISPSLHLSSDERSLPFIGKQLSFPSALDSPCDSPGADPHRFHGRVACSLVRPLGKRHPLATVIASVWSRDSNLLVQKLALCREGKKRLKEEQAASDWWVGDLTRKENYIGVLSWAERWVDLCTACQNLQSLWEGFNGAQSRLPPRQSPQYFYSLKAESLKTTPAVGTVGRAYIPRTGQGGEPLMAWVQLVSHLAVMSSWWPPPRSSKKNLSEVKPGTFAVTTEKESLFSLGFINWQNVTWSFWKPVQGEKL